MNSRHVIKYIIRSFIIVGLFYVSTIIVLPFISPSVFAAPIWPAAGLGTAVMIICGHRYIPVVFLGEVLLTVSFLQMGKLSSGTEYIVAYTLLIIVAIVRNIISAYLVKTHLGNSNLYLTSASVVKLFIFAGVIPALFSSSFSTFILYSNDLLNNNLVLNNAVLWWFGDAIGILVIVPLMFLFFKKPREVWEPRQWKVFVPIVISVVMLYAITINLNALEKKKVVASLDKDTSYLIDIMMQKLSTNFTGLHNMPQQDLTNEINRLFTESISVEVSKEPLDNIHFEIYSYEGQDKVKLFDAKRLVNISDVAKTTTYCNISDHLWEIEAYATPNYYLKKGIWLTWWLLVIGFMFVAFLMAGLLVLTGHSILIKDKVKERTKEIETLNNILIDRERRYKQVVDVQPVMFWKHSRGSIKLDYITDELLRKLGYGKDDLVDLSIFWNKIVHPDDRNKILTQYINGVKSRESFTLKYRLVCKSGEILWFKDYISISKNNGKIEVFGMKIDITKDQESALRITELAYYDEMTKLPNRVHFMEYLSGAMAMSKEKDCFGAVLFMDLDRFKVLNDSMGHYFGDQLLKKIGQRLTTITNKEVIPSRFGGDEFTVLINKSHETLSQVQKEAHAIASHIQQLILKPFNIDGHQFYTSLSIGISIFPHDSDKAEEAIQQADIAMYTSKTEGNSIIRFFQPQMLEKAKQRLLIEKSLKSALHNQEFEMYYQPMFDANKKVVKMEALLRWNHPDKGVLLPSSFINIAEETGFIVELSEWIINDVFSCINQWPVDEITLLPISINISLFQFNNAKVIDFLRSSSEKYRIEESMVILELTESIGIGDMKDVLPKLHELKSLGFLLAIDDFGSGYSSLKYLTQMPIDIVKLDKSFIDKIGQDNHAETLIEAIVLMIRKLNLNTVIEGVETSQQLDFLKSLGCQTFQGYIFSQALQFDDLMQLLRDNNR